MFADETLSDASSSFVVVVIVVRCESRRFVGEKKSVKNFCEKFL